MRFYLTNKDRLNAYNAQLDDLCKPALRYFLAALGFLAILVPAALLLFRLETKPGFLDLVFFIVGAVLIRAWIIAPVIKRRKISNGNAPAQMTNISIDEDTISRESGNTPEDPLEWSEINKIVDTENGVIIYPNKSKLIWLPKRVFESEAVLDEFLNLAGRKGML